MEPTPDIISIFDGIYRKSKEIRLLNVFKGIPIANTAALTDVGVSSINVKTDPFQMVCLYRERQTYIQNEAIPGTVLASVSHIDFAKVEGVLSDFQMVKGNIGVRNQIRVEPDSPIQGAVMTNEMRRPLTAELADISQDGLAIYIKTRFFFADYYKVDAPVTVFIPAASLHYKGEIPRTAVKWYMENDLKARSSSETLRLDPLAGQPRQVSFITSSSEPLYKKVTEIELRGVIANVHQDALRNRYRIGIRLLREDPARAVLMQFITQRQTEIINELRAVYNLLSMISHQP